LPAGLRQPRDRHDIPVELPSEGIDLEATLDRIEQRYMQLALERVGGIQTRAAELLGVSFRQFRYKLDKFQQRRGEPRGEPRTKPDDRG
jgi:two-component system response regulator PilR (NtrC family)